MRHFIRHPLDIPIHVSNGNQSAGVHSVRNVSAGGLAFYSDRELQRGALVDVTIPFVQPVFESKARVVWCSTCRNGFDLGVEFLNAEDAFRARMVEQVCHIENYKKTMHETEGRELTATEAAIEWIAKYAARFPHPGPGPERGH